MTDDTVTTFNRRTPPAANFSDSAVARRPPPPLPATEPAPPAPSADAEDAEPPAPGEQLEEPVTPVAPPTPNATSPGSPQTTTPSGVNRPDPSPAPRPARRAGAARTQEPSSPPPATAHNTAVQDRRGGFRPVTIGLNPDDMDWFDQQRATAGSQRALLLELLAEYGPDVVPVEDAINTRRAQLGLSPTRPPARQGRMISINVSMHHDEADAFDTAAEKSGRSRSGYCEELIRLARVLADDGKKPPRAEPATPG